MRIGRSIMACPDPEVAALARRAGRVTWLLVGVLALSAADLVVTLTHLRTLGLPEANPIAAWLIRTTGSVWVLSLYKAVTVGTCVTLLYHLRRHLAGEIASWCAIGILVGMALLWHAYTEEIATPRDLQLARGQHADAWLRID
jgi:hypothetical protein